MKSLRSRVLTIAVVPGAALVLVALVVGIFLVLQANRVRVQADRTVHVSNDVTRTVAGLQKQRARAERPVADALTQRIGDAIGGLRELARAAPDAETAYGQSTAVDLLVAAEGLYRADSLALGGLDASSRPLFADAVGGFRTTLAGAATRLTPSGRTRYATLVRSDDWHTLTAVDNALAAAAPLPVTPAAWRTATAGVGRALGELFAQQNDFAVQLIVDRAHRTLVGALAAAAAIAGLAVVVMTVAVQLADRLASPTRRWSPAVGVRSKRVRRWPTRAREGMRQTGARECSPGPAVVPARVGRGGAGGASAEPRGA